MVNANKLRGKIMENGMTIGTVADAIGISASTLGRKIKNQADMTLNEVEMLCSVLDIPREQILQIFFCDGKAGNVNGSRN